VLCPKDVHYEKTISNLQEVKAREGQIIAVCTAGDREVEDLVEERISMSRIPVRGATGLPERDLMEIPDAEPEVLPLLTVIPLQLLAYYMADLKGTDVDQPRNLAKTVTVE
jgi:glucosamine--fructose-6-phosphate aminotransferase (isomerizing)